MKIRNFEDLNLQEVDTMREISSIGTSHAATALSKFLQKEIRITLPQVSILGYEDAVDRIGNIEEVVAATLVKMDGDVDGLMLFLFNMDFANTVLGKLLDKTIHPLRKWMHWPIRRWRKWETSLSALISMLFHSWWT